MSVSESAAAAAAALLRRAAAPRRPDATAANLYEQYNTMQYAFTE